MRCCTGESFHQLTNEIMPQIDVRGRLRTAICLLGCVASLAMAPSSALLAQTDYYNTDTGRPLTIEDAYAVEFRAIEIQATSFRFTRAPGKSYVLGMEPELALGILPRTQFEVGTPLAVARSHTGETVTGLAGVELSVLYNLNAETSLPAFAIAGDVLIPAGPLSPGKAYPGVKAIATRSLPWARFHLNGQYTFGKSEAGGGAHGELSRWMSGVAVDRTFPLRSLLISAEVVARGPMHSGSAVWQAGVGTRLQLSPRFAADAGAGFDFNGPDKGWFITFGSAAAIGLPWKGRGR